VKRPDYRKPVAPQERFKKEGRKSDELPQEAKEEGMKDSGRGRSKSR